MQLFLLPSCEPRMATKEGLDAHYSEPLRAAFPIPVCFSNVWVARSIRVGI